MGCLRRAATPLLVGLLAAVALPAGVHAFEAETWVEARTPHFVLFSDAGRERAEEIATSLETFRAVFARLAPEIDLRSPTPTVILAFRDADSYAPYKTLADRGEAKVLGQFLTYRDGNYLTLNADPRYLGAFAVVFHEYVHYLVRHNFPGVPRWFNEGLAEYYSTFAVEGEVAVVGRPVERHRLWLAHEEPRLHEVLTRPSEHDREVEAERDGRFYAVSWGLVHYLLSGDPGTRDALTDLLVPERPGGDPVEAFEEALGARVHEVEERLVGYLLGPEVPVARLSLGDLPATGGVAVASARPARILGVLGGLASRLDLHSLAEKQLDLALRYEPHHAEALAELAHLRDREGRRNEASVLFREAIAEAPPEARVWFLYGRHQLDLLLEGGPDPEGADRAARALGARDAFARAVELDPEFGEARALLGYSHLFGDLEAAEGLPHVERAIELLPGRGDLLVAQVQLLLKDGEPERALEVVEREPEAWGSPGLQARAREEVQRWQLLEAAERALRAGETEDALGLFEEAIEVTTDTGLRTRMAERLEALREGLAQGGVR